MSNISQYLAAINSAIYGKDVRGAIHDAIETINDDVKDLPASFDDLEDDFNTLSDNVTDLSCDISDTNNCINEALPFLRDTNKFVSIEGTVNMPLKQLIIYGKSVQDGTPSPSSPAAIVTAGSGGTLPMVSAGKNLIPFTYGASKTISGVTFTPNPDGTVTVSGTNTGSSNADFNVFRSAISGFLPNGTYRVSGFPTDGTGLSACVLTVRTNDKSGGNANYTSIPSSGRTFACRDSGTITSIYISIAPGTAVNAVYRPMVNVGTSAGAYAPPVAIASTIPTPNGLPGIPVESGGNYTDTDGQRWLCDTIDLEAGAYTQRCHVRTVTSVGHVETGAPNRPYFFIRYSDDSADINDGYIAGETEPPAAMADYLPRVPRGEWWAGTMDGITITSHGNVAIRLPGCTTKAQADAYLAEHPLSIVYAQAAPVVNQLTEAKLTALRALRGRKGLTNLYSADPVEPEFRTEMHVDIPTYIQSVIKKPLSLYDLNITPGSWNNIHPDFDSETEEYAVTLRNGYAATVNAVVIGTSVTVEFSNIGGAVTYFTTSTSSSAVGDRKTYSCNVSPFDAGVGGGLVMTVTDGNATRRYYLNITSVG